MAFGIQNSVFSTAVLGLLFILFSSSASSRKLESRPDSVADIISNDRAKELESALAGLNPIATFAEAIIRPEDNTPTGPEDEDENTSGSGEKGPKQKEKADCQVKANETPEGPALVHMDFDHMCQEAKEKQVKILPVYVVGWELKQCSEINKIPYKRFKMDKYQGKKPKFDIPGMCHSLKGREMTLMMIDPDAPSRNNHRCRSWLHWLVVNIPKGNVSKGDEIVEYKPPSPPVGSGPHRYFLILYDQGNHIKKIDDSENNLAVRCGFSVRNFAEDNSLVGPVAINMFETNNKKDL